MPAATVVHAALALVPSTAHKEPLSWCAGVGLMFGRPATIEWTDWVTAGGGSRTEIGGGLGFDVRIARGRGYDGQNRFELRAGPWAAATASFPGFALEGGLSIDLGMTSHSEWGNGTLRVGAGEADLGGGERPAISMTFAYGVRSVLARYSWGGGCVTSHGIEPDNPGRPAQRFAHASGARLFVTLREDADRRTAIIAGVELEPTFFLPPYSLSRFGGGEPE